MAIGGHNTSSLAAAPRTVAAAGNRVGVERTDALLAEIKAAAQIDLAMLAVANRQLRTLSDGRI